MDNERVTITLRIDNAIDVTPGNTGNWYWELHHIERKQDFRNMSFARFMQYIVPMAESVYNKLKEK
jgi:hypothetical protein